MAPLPSGTDIVASLRRQLGKPYVYGAEGPDAFDCSGLIQYALRGLGVRGVPRTSEAQWAWRGLENISYGELRPGDFVFSDWPGDGQSPGHVAIYSGDGKIIEAARTGVPVHEIALSPYYRRRVKGYKRLSGARMAGGAVSEGAGGVAGTAGDQQSGITSGLLGIGRELAAASEVAAALLLPATWVRITAALLGLAAITAGAWLLIEEAGSNG